MQSTKHSVWNIANIQRTLTTFIPSFWKLELPENRKFPRAVKRKQKEEGHSHIKILRYGVPSNTVKKRRKRSSRASGVGQHLQRTSGQNRKRTPPTPPLSSSDKNLLHRGNWAGSECLSAKSKVVR